MTHSDLAQRVSYVLFDPWETSVSCLCGPVKCHWEAATLTPVQISAGHSYSSWKDKATLVSYVTLTMFTFTCSLTVPKAPFVRKALQPGRHTLCQRQPRICPDVGPGTGPQSPTETSSLWWVRLGTSMSLPLTNLHRNYFRPWKKWGRRHSLFSPRRFFGSWGHSPTSCPEPVLCCTEHWETEFWPGPKGITVVTIGKRNFTCFFFLFSTFFFLFLPISGSFV